MKVFPETAYCMNLNSRGDRWEQVTSDFKRLESVLNIQLERVPAVDNPQNPAAGVTSTFKGIIQMARDTEKEFVLIVEDDLFVVDPVKVRECLENVPDDWDILLGGVYHYAPDSPHDNNWMKLRDFCSLHFIIIRDRIYDKVLNINSGRHFDRSLGQETKKKIFNTYVMHPMPCQQRPGFSNLRKKAVNDNTRKLPWVNHPDLLQ